MITSCKFVFALLYPSASSGNFGHIDFNQGIDIQDDNLNMFWSLGKESTYALTPGSDSGQLCIVGGVGVAEDHFCPVPYL